MELFRVAGLSSEDLMRPGTSSAKAFLGTMFKMGAPPAGSPQAEAQAEADAESRALAAAALANGGQPPDPSTAPDDHRWTENDLMAMKKDKLVELAGSLSVADLGGTKQELVVKILAAQ